MRFRLIIPYLALSLPVLFFLCILPGLGVEKRAYLVPDDAETLSTSLLIPQVGVEATASGAQGAEDAVCVDTVDTGIAPVLC